MTEKRHLKPLAGTRRAEQSGTVAPSDMACTDGVGREASSPKASRSKGPLPETVARYRKAVELYAATDMTARRISEQCGVPVNGFLNYLRKYRRDLLLARHGFTVPGEASDIRLRGRSGQTVAAHTKYKEAILACDDKRYLNMNVSQIARSFGVDPTGLGNQLRTHYPDILERREKERRRLGIADNGHRGVRRQSTECYAEAVELLRTTDKTITEAADTCGVSPSGLKQHLLFYHKDLVAVRSRKREKAKLHPKRGEINGNGSIRRPKKDTEEKYAEAVELYRTTTMTVHEIADRMGVNRNTLRAYLRMWDRETAFARQGAEYSEEAKLSELKRYRPSTAAKYAPAIERLRNTGLPTAKVAAEFGLQPECFRAYLREHFPDLYARQGMTQAGNGRTVSYRSMEKYAEAIRLYETTDEGLKSIARRLGLVYNSLGNFLRRNFPELIEAHSKRVAGKSGGTE